MSRKLGTSQRGRYYLNRNVCDSICKVERGKATNKVRFEIYKRDGYRCKMCGVKSDGKNLEIDHIIPISKGGTSESYNLQILCK